MREDAAAESHYFTKDEVLNFAQDVIVHLKQKADTKLKAFTGKDFLRMRQNWGFLDFIDSHAEQIAEYLNARAKALREHADKIETKTS